MNKLCRQTVLSISLNANLILKKVLLNKQISSATEHQSHYLCKYW